MILIPAEIEEHCRRDEIGQQLMRSAMSQLGITVRRIAEQSACFT